MIIGLGIDICDVKRMRRQLDAPAADFLEAVFLPDEISYCQDKHRPAEHYAARFAAKEAVLKALAPAQGEGSFWLDIEIRRTPAGMPYVVLDGRLRKLADDLGLENIHLSLTHSAETAAAVAVAEGRHA